MPHEHPALRFALSALLALLATVALLGASGLLAALLGGLAWLALPERGMRLTAARPPSRRALRR